VRPRIWDEPEVKSWYVQNMLLFVDGELLESRPRLAREHERAQGRPLSVVHPRVFRAVSGRLARAEEALAEHADRGGDPSGSRMPPERA
jgi:hypothetical protein